MIPSLPWLLSLLACAAVMGLAIVALARPDAGADRRSGDSAGDAP